VALVAGGVSLRRIRRRRPSLSPPDARARVIIGSVRRALVLLCLLAPSAPARAETIGHSVRGRPIELRRIGAADAPRKVLVMGCIHGNERAGIAVTRALRSVTPPAGVELLLVDSANPDGAAANTRGNARGVDLNRNFPWRWRPLGGVYYSGPRPASEPETRALRRMILRERPQISIWFHQHLNFVDLQAGGDEALMRRYARTAHMRAAPYPQIPGGIARWENHVLPNASAFVVELAAGALPTWRVRANVRAVLAVARDSRDSPRSRVPH
jgi:protein MpaA